MFAVANTALLVAQLRLLMVNVTLVSNPLSAYIIPAGDAHHTEFIAECHQRRAFISGFTGSAGTAIVATDPAIGAFLWTDGRYYLQAENQLDNTTWGLMKDGFPGTPSQADWLNKNLPVDAYVGVDPTLYSKSEWDLLETELKTTNKRLIGVPRNLVDIVWAGARPSCASNPLVELEMQFSGKNTADKLRDVRNEMSENGASVLVVTELDEVAWLLNLRGDKDIPTSSTFFSYVVITNSTIEFFANPSQSTPVRANLIAQVPNIQFSDYTLVVPRLTEIVANKPTGKVWFSKNANYALVSLVASDDQLIKLTPISLMKAVKNDVEVEGYRRALTRDAVAISVFFAWLEDALSKGEQIYEISAGNKLEEIRKQRENFMDLSFTTISATGENGAIIHYMPTTETNTMFGKEDMYLLDSGGLYKDGTTDITRTIHFGTPTAHQIECYTRVLKGQIALARAIFPNKLVGHRLDSFARQALWNVGLDYAHGTGHGIGSYLNVHEGPSSISFRFSADDQGLRENMFTSNEPGYYEDNAFGIRLENIVRVVNKTLKHNFQGLGFLGFEDMTLLPYSHKLIDVNLLTDEEIEYLNDYQEKCRTVLGQYIKDFNVADGEAAMQWIEKETPPISREIVTEPPTTTPSAATYKTMSSIFSVIAFAVIHLV